IDAPDLREAIVQKRAAGGHCWDRAVENDAMALVLIEAAVDEVAKIAPTLRISLRQRAIEHRTAAGGQWIRGAGVVGAGVAHERYDIARGREPDPRDRRIRCLVDELVDRTDLEGGALGQETYGLCVDE